MRIYIDDYDVSKIKNKLHVFSENIASSKKRLYLLSEDGMFYTNHNKIFKVFVENENDIIHINNYVNNLNIVVDNSIEVHKQVYSLPYEHTIFNTITLTITLKQHDNIKLVLFCKPHEPSACKFFKKSVNNNGDGIDIIDFYFETNFKDIANDDLKKSIIMFLSLLN